MSTNISTEFEKLLIAWPEDNAVKEGNRTVYSPCLGRDWWSQREGSTLRPLDPESPELLRERGSGLGHSVRRLGVRQVLARFLGVSPTFFVDVEILLPVQAHFFPLSIVAPEH